MEENKIFRSSFFISFIHVYLIFLIIVFVGDGFDINIEAFFVGSAFVLIFTFVLIRYFKITITNTGIKGYGFWGKYHSIEWEDIVDVKPLRIIGLKYIRVFNTRTKRPLWLPLFLSDMNRFKEEIQAIVPHNNPMNLFFKNQK